jgi:hypothetical protein
MLVHTTRPPTFPGRETSTVAGDLDVLRQIRATGHPPGESAMLSVEAHVARAGNRRSHLGWFFREEEQAALDLARASAYAMDVLSTFVVRWRGSRREDWQEFQSWRFPRH